MTTVNNVSDASAALAAATSASTGTSSASASGDAESRFLTLLVTQLKNQDPLNPMDNAQMTSQMAQISTVNGIEKLNTTLQGMVTSYTAGQAVQAAAMIGHSVFVPGDTMQLAAGKATFGIDMPQAVDDAVVSVINSSGQVVHKADLGAQPAGVLGFEWDGATDSGATAADGSYTFKVEAKQGGKTIDATALALGAVSGVTQDASGVALKVGGLGSVALADVRQVM